MVQGKPLAGEFLLLSARDISCCPHAGNAPSCPQTTPQDATTEVFQWDQAVAFTTITIRKKQVYNLIKKKSPGKNEKQIPSCY